MVEPGEETSGKSEHVNGNELVLFSYHHCVYSQKVLMALYEKNIPFTTKLVNIYKGDQYKLDYLKINPKAEVPVLKDGIKYIPDSERIIEYLEDNFSNGGHSRLIPIDQGLEVKQKVTAINKMLISIPLNVVTMGSFLNDKICFCRKYPFFLPFVRESLKAPKNSSGERAKAASIMYPEFKEILENKISEYQNRKLLETDKNEFENILKKVDDILDIIEKQYLNENKMDWWLCTDRFTIADISLTVLLDRLARLGLEQHFWGGGKRPKIENYYLRVQQRDSYKKTIPTFITDLSIIVGTPLIIGVSLFTVITVVVGGLFYFRIKQ